MGTCKPLHCNKEVTLKRLQHKDTVSLKGARWEHNRGKGGSEVRLCRHICYCSKLNLISRGQVNREKGAARSAPLGWVLCQNWPKLRGSAEKSKASTRAGTATVSHSVWEMEPVTLQHLPTILLSICWFTCQETVVCACMCAYLWLSHVCATENGCFHLGRCVCTRTDREGIELKRMR